MSEEQTATPDSTEASGNDIIARLTAAMESPAEQTEKPEEEQEVVEEATDEVIDESQEVEEESEESDEVEDPTEISRLTANPFQSKKLSLDTCGNPITPRRRKLLPNSVRLLKIKQQLTNPH